jgi:hypothetical protein
MGWEGPEPEARTLWAYIDPTFVREQIKKYHRRRVKRSRGMVKGQMHDGPYNALYLAIIIALAQNNKAWRQYRAAEDQVQKVRQNLQNARSSHG